MTKTQKIYLAGLLIIIIALNFIPPALSQDHGEKGISEVTGAEVIFIRGQQYYKLKLYDNAIKEFNTILERAPYDPRAERSAFLVGDCYYQLAKENLYKREREVSRGYFQLSLNTYRKSMNKYPNSPFIEEAMYRFADIHLNLGLYYESMSYFIQYLNKYPQGKEQKNSLLGRAKSYLMLGMNDKARIDFLEVLSTYHRKEDCIAARQCMVAFFGLGDIYYQEGDMESALRQYEDGAKRWPRYVKDHPETMFKLSETLVFANRFDDALRILFTLQGQYSKTDFADEVQVRIGDVFLKSDDRRGAINSYSMTISRYPDTLGEMVAKIRLADLVEETKNEFVAGYDDFEDGIYTFDITVNEVTSSDLRVTVKARENNETILTAIAAAINNSLDNAVASVETTSDGKCKFLAIGKGDVPEGYKISLKDKTKDAAAKGILLQAGVLIDSDADGLGDKVIEELKIRVAGTGGAVTKVIVPEEVYNEISTKYPLHPLSELALWKWALLLRERDEYSASLKVFKEMIARFPSGPIKERGSEDMKSTFKEGIRFYFDRGEYKDLLRFHDEFIGSVYLSKAYDRDVMFLIGEAFFYLEFYPKARESMKAILDENPPDDVEEYALFVIGKSYMLEGELKRAEEIFIDLLKEFPDGKHWVDVMYFLGDAYFYQKKYEDALRIYQTVLKESPTHKRALVSSYNLGNSFKALDRFVEAAGVYQKTIDLYKSEGEALPPYFIVESYFLKGDCLFDAGKFQEALSVYMKARSTFPEDNRSQWALYRIGEIQESLKGEGGGEESIKELKEGGQDLWRDIGLGLTDYSHAKEEIKKYFEEE